MFLLAGNSLKEYLCKNVTGTSSRNREEKILIHKRSVHSDKSKKGMVLTGSDIIFAFEKIKEHVVTQAEKNFASGPALRYTLVRVAWRALE